MTTLVIDGKNVSASRGRSILEICRDAGISVPTLCFLEGVSAAGACRLCLVEVKGLPRPVAACTTPALEGMIVATSTERLRAHRRTVVEMLLRSGEHVCAFCAASGRCELQRMAQELDVDHFSSHADVQRHGVDASRARFAFDRGRCILCTRCVRVCSELERAGTLGVGGRGASTHVFTDGGERWGNSVSCTDCGRCVAACPTGALFEKAPAMGRPGGSSRREGLPRVATVWLGGCSGCHMSLLDLDEGLLELWRGIDLVYSPLVDAKDFPCDVDLCLVEGAVATDADLEMLRSVRQRSRVLVALGDCAAHGNITAMRNGRGGAQAVLRRAWPLAPDTPRHPAVPALLDPVRPLHDVVDVDVFVPGCPPAADAIGHVITRTLSGEWPRLGTRARFG